MFLGYATRMNSHRLYQLSYKDYRNPLPIHYSPFTIMNYFELYQIPLSLQPDLVQVKAKFYELSRLYHPDFHGQGTEEEQAEALETASQVNMAWKVFQHPDETLKYVLQLKGLLEEEEKYQLSPEFLMEVMDLNDPCTLR
eukprot:Opistho-1_new@33368